MQSTTMRSDHTGRGSACDPVCKLLILILETTMMTSRIVTLFGFALFVQTGNLHGEHDAGHTQPFAPSQLLQNARGENAGFTGIARVNASGNCTGFFPAVAGGEKAPAVVLTNGHCVQFWGRPRSAFEVVRDQNVEPRSVDVVFNYFIDTQDKAVRVPVKSIRYSTMKGIDLAVLELDATTEELMTQGVTPIAIAQNAPVTGAPIHVVGTPGAIMDPYLRKAECLEEGVTDLVESRWHWYGSHRNRCSDIAAGSSGSPVLDEKGQAYAIVNTTFEGKSAPCALNNPCEVSPTGMAFRKDTSYGSSLIGLRRCFNAQGMFQPEAKGCPLETAPPLTSDTAPHTPTRPADSYGDPLTWEISLEGPYSEVRTKLGLATQTDCRDISGYSAPIPRDDPRLATALLPTQEGVHFLCILGLAAESPPDARFPMVVVAAIDTTPPKELPRVTATPAEEGGVRIELVTNPPELSSYQFAFGPLASTDCKAVELSSYPYRFTIRPEYLPARLCVQALDTVGNHSPMFEYHVIRASSGRLDPGS